MRYIRQMNQCSIPGCKRPSKTRGWCAAHYERWRKNGNPAASGKGNSKRNVSVTLACETCGSRYHPWKGRETTSRTCSRRCNAGVSAKENAHQESDFDRLTELSDGCWNWKGTTREDGYGEFFIAGKRYRAHRYAYERAYGAIAEGLFICHRCDNRACVRPDHLFCGTQLDNMQDMSAKGRHGGPNLRGEAHPGAKITALIAEKIRSDPRVAKAVAAEHQISTSTVWAIRSGRLWRQSLPPMA